MRLGCREHHALGIGIAQTHEGRGEIAPLAPSDVGQCQREADIVGVAAEADQDASDAGDVVARGNCRKRRLRQGGSILRGDQLGVDEGEIGGPVERRPALAIDRFRRSGVPVDDRDHRLAEARRDAGEDRLLCHRLPEPAEADDGEMHAIDRHAFGNGVSWVPGEHLARHDLRFVEDEDARGPGFDRRDAVGHQPVAGAAPDRGLDGAFAARWRSRWRWRRWSSRRPASPQPSGHGECWPRRSGLMSQRGAR